MPTWILQRLGESGPRGAKPSRCPSCRRPTLTGLDADRCAMTVTVDASEVDEFGEALALLRWSTSFDLTLIGGQWELCHRNQHHIKRGRKYPVFVRHECGFVYPRAEHTHPLFITREVKPLPDQPPF